MTRTRVSLRTDRSVVRNPAVGRAAILIARAEIIDRLMVMGAKYLPTIKDQRLNLRFHQKQTALAKAKKSTAAPAPKVSKKK